MKFAFALGLSLLAVAAVAGVTSDKSAVAVAAPSAKKSEATGRTEVVPINHEFARAGTRPKLASKGPSLRCWQYGRLIFEEPVSNVSAPPSANGYRFEGNAGNIQVLDMHNASCLIK